METMHDTNDKATVVLSRIVDKIKQRSLGGSDNISQPNDWKTKIIWAWKDKSGSVVTLRTTGNKLQDVVIFTAIGKEIRGEAYSSTVYPDHLKPVDLTEIKEYRKHFSMSKQELSQESIATLLKQIDIDFQKTLAQRDEYIKKESEKKNQKAQEDGRVKAKELLQKEAVERSARSASEAELLKRLQ